MPKTKRPMKRQRISNDPYKAVKQALEYHPEMLEFMGVGNPNGWEDKAPDVVSKYLEQSIRRRKYEGD
jgi:hypothetical protein